MSIEGTPYQQNTFEVLLENWMDNQHYPQEAKDKLHRYIGHSLLSHEAALDVLILDQYVRDAQDSES